MFSRLFCPWCARFSPKKEKTPRFCEDAPALPSLTLSVCDLADTALTRAFLITPEREDVCELTLIREDGKGTVLIPEGTFRAYAAVILESAK